MSWDNVAGVSSAQIWTDNPDMTQAWLFANGNHQVKLTIGISFNLTDKTQPGPTQDEVSAALTLINYESGAGLSYLKAGAAGDYLATYLPNTAPTVKQAAAADTGHIQYEILYYLSSDSSINPSYMSEKVALLLTYTNKDGQEIEYSTAYNSKSQSFVEMTIFAPKKYGVSGSELTPVIIKVKDDKPGFAVMDKYNNVTTINNSAPTTYSLRIDDDYYKIIKMESSDTIPSDYGFYFNNMLGREESAGVFDSTLEEAFVPASNKINQGVNTYESTLYLNTNHSQNLFSVQFSITQTANEIIFIHYPCNIVGSGYTFINDTAPKALKAYEQFGNPINMEISVSGGNIKIDSVT